MNMSNTKANKTTQHRARRHLLKKDPCCVLLDPDMKKIVIKQYNKWTENPIKKHAFSIIRFHYDFEADNFYRTGDGRYISPWDCQLVQVKATVNPKVGPSFKNFYFSITENEEYMAMMLGYNYRFALVNLLTNEHRLCSFNQLMNNAKRVTQSYSLELRGLDY